MNGERERKKQDGQSEGQRERESGSVRKIEEEVENVIQERKISDGAR